MLRHIIKFFIVYWKFIFIKHTVYLLLNLIALTKVHSFIHDLFELPVHNKEQTQVHVESGRLPAWGWSQPISVHRVPSVKRYACCCPTNTFNSLLLSLGVQWFFFFVTFFIFLNEDILLIFYWNIFDICMVWRECLVLSDPLQLSGQAPLSMGFPRQEY